MGGGVPTPIRGHIAVRIRHYRIFIITRMLFQLQLQLVHTPTLIYEPYSLLLPPTYGRWGYWPPLLSHHNVKDWPRGNVLCHTDVVLEDIPPNKIQPSPSPSITSPIWGYYKWPFQQPGIYIETHHTTQLWRLPSTRRMQGVITHNSDSKIITDLTIAK